MVAKGTVTGAESNVFQADGISGGTGGGVEIGSGLTKGTLSTASFSKPVSTLASNFNLLPGQVTNTTGALIRNPASGGGVTNLASVAVPLTPSQLTLNHGAIVIDSVTPTSSVSFGSVQILVHASKPTAAQAQLVPTEDVVVDTDEDVLEEEESLAHK